MKMVFVVTFWFWSVTRLRQTVCIPTLRLLLTSSRLSRVLSLLAFFLFFSFSAVCNTVAGCAATAFKVNATIECRLAQLTGEFELVCVEIEAYISEIDKPPSQGAPNRSECDDRDPLCPRRGRLLLAVASSVRSLHLQGVIVPK